jgi:glycosyltransferase involved in cell wall biosynthesis
MSSVLHVTARWGGGIATAVQQYVESTPDLTHYLMCRDNIWAVRDQRDLFAKTWTLPPSRAVVGAIRETIVSHQIDVVHAHSSHAGAFVRLGSMPARVVYTPHAFALLAKRGSKEWIVGQAERLLGLRPIVIAAVSEDELRLARKYSPRSESLRIPNLPVQTLRPSAAYRPELKVAMVGRISAQKDPVFYAQVAAEARKANRPYAFHWFGDGEPALKSVLTTAGVVVSGWLSAEQLHAEHATAQVHLHTARYEGSCLSVLDAAAIGLPTIGRAVPGVRDVGWLITVNTPEEALRELDRAAEPDWWLTCSRRSLSGISEHTSSNLRRQLLCAYGLDDSCSR